MARLFFIIVLIFLVTASKISLAADGCIANVPLQTNGTLFTELYASNVNEFDAYGIRYTNPNSVYCIRSRSGSCTVRGFAGSYTGTPVTYNLPVGCPIDDSLILMMSPLIVCAFFLQRKSKLYHIS